MAFTQKLDAASLEFFNEVSKRTFSQQACAFLNAYWEEVGDQAEFIFSFAWETIKYADMHAKGCSYVHLYEEGDDLDFNIGLYFYEKMVQRLSDDAAFKKWKAGEFSKSQPEMMTAIVRKKELRDKVDVNFDGRISFLEYLLYQYREFANPKDFTTRSMGKGDPEAIRKAMEALEEVNKRIRAYEAERMRLEEQAKLPGVKGLTAKNQLAQLDSSPLKEDLNTALIKAEAAVRIASRPPKVGGPVPTQGSVWWMNRDLTEKKKRYGR